jgi:D-glucosaminate-6-phosphate ammonia-lyase
MAVTREKVNFMSIYESLGVKPIINGTGVWTRLGGSLMPQEVVEAMAEASRHYVCLEDLQHAAGQIIAEITGAEAAYVTSGAYAALVLAVASCMTGLDAAKMDRLPHSAGMRNEVLLDFAQRTNYDHAAEVPGARLIIMGEPQGATLADLQASLSDQTACVLYVPDMAKSRLALDETIAAAHARNIPVVVDAAGREDDPDGLYRYVRAGADLVAFSGGKYLRGPQASGFVCGRKDLISAVAWQHLDMDIVASTWTAPRELVDPADLEFIPRQGIGRGYKAGKEEIVGLITALRRFVGLDHAAERAGLAQLGQSIVNGLAGVPHIQAEFLPAGAFRPGIPHVRVRLDESAAGMDAYAFIRALKQGDPPIHPLERELAEGNLIFNTFCLREGEPEIITQRIRELLSITTR